MEATQSFRLIGKLDTHGITCHRGVDGKNVVLLEDIEQVFPGIKIVPFRIQHYPDVVLDVVISTNDSVEHPTARTPICVPNMNRVVEGLQVTSPPPLAETSSTPFPSSHSGLKSGSKIKLTFKNVVELAQKKAHESEIEQRLISSMPREIQEQLRASSAYGSIVQAIKNGQVEHSDQFMGHFQELTDKLDVITKLTTENKELVTQMAKQQDEMKQLQIQALKRQEEMKQLQIQVLEQQEEMKQLQIQALKQLSLLQTRVQAVMTQTYELHEYPIPRLFVVLPHGDSSWNIKNPFSNNFRLYFLCQCGEHTKSTNSKVPHYIHLAKHEGYDITRPTEFFKQYGPYVLTILKMLKFGISVAGITLPALSQLVSIDAIDEAPTSRKQLSRNIMPGMDQVIGCIEKASVDEGETIDGIKDRMENNGSLEGPDLRKLDTFLENKDGSKVLGNLYRTVTTEGHVKWVCIDHYRENYQTKAAKAFRDTVDALDGSFDENVGRVKVKIRSKVQADQFYLALENAKSVYELKIRLYWDATFSDFERLRDTLYKTNIGVLELDPINCHPQLVSTDILNRGRRYDPIFDIIRHPSIRSFEVIDTPPDLFQRSSLLSRNDDFSHLRYLRIRGKRVNVEGIPNLKSLFANAPNLTSLGLESDWKSLAAVYNAVVEYQTYPIDFFSRREDILRIPPPPRDSAQSKISVQNPDQLFKVYGGQIESFWCDKEMRSSVLDALAEATQ
ncbi:hypothetical protein BGZ65_006070, partial [Modicella reniformis]